MALKELTSKSNRKFKMGRRRPAAKAPKLQLKKYLRLAQLPTVPATCDYTAKAMPALQNIYLNDQLGDCVIAGGYHIIGTATGNAGNLFTATNAQIIADYGAIGGYVPGDSSTDNGCDEVTALNYWTNNGFADQSKITGWVAVDPANQQEIMAAMFLFENLMFGMELPDGWVSPMPEGSGFTWDVAGPQDPNNGHCVVGVGYDTNGGVAIDSWGYLGKITWPAIAQYCADSNGGGLYVFLTPDQIQKGQTKAPNGVDWQTLQQDLQSLSGGNGNPPGPGGSQAGPSDPPTPVADPVSPTFVSAFGGYLVVLNLLLIYLLIKIWPSTIPAPAKESLTLFWGIFSWPDVTSETRLLLIAMIAGALGAYIHLATSFGDFVGNKKFVGSWTWWYGLRPFIGVALAVIVYFVIRAGMISPPTGTDTVGPFGVAAFTGMVGMFSKQAVDKLKEIFETVFAPKKASDRSNPLKDPTKPS